MQKVSIILAQKDGKYHKTELGMIFRISLCLLLGSEQMLPMEEYITKRHGIQWKDTSTIRVVN